MKIGILINGMSGIRGIQRITTVKKKQAFTEAMGRIIGWWSLLFNKPSVNE